MRILPEIANLMYQITALMLSKQRRDHAPREPENQSDEAQEREEVIRTDMVQSMLEKVLTLLCNLVRSKKELAERVRSHCAHVLRMTEGSGLRHVANLCSFKF